MVPSKDALLRLSVLALQWSARAELTLGQQTMARMLTRQAARLAVAPTANRDDVEVVKQMCCNLYPAVHGGGRPNLAQCTFGECNAHKSAALQYVQPTSITESGYP